jgi:DNA polymerase III epsilon subunit-like protein
MVFTAADVETTGLDARDRIVELAAVVLRGDGEIPDEYATRDMGATPREFESRILRHA